MDIAHVVVSDITAWFDRFNTKPGAETTIQRSYDVKSSLDNAELDAVKAQLAALVATRGLDYDVRAVNRGIKGAAYVTVTLSPPN